MIPTYIAITVMLAIIMVAILLAVGKLAIILFENLNGRQGHSVDLAGRFDDAIGHIGLVLAILFLCTLDVFIAIGITSLWASVS